MWINLFVFISTVGQLILQGKAGFTRGTCETSPLERTDCGFSTKQECEANDCCYNDQTLNVPWCFVKRRISMIDCGFENGDMCGYTELSGHANARFHTRTGQSASQSSSAGITSSSEGAWYIFMECSTLAPQYTYTSLISPEEQPVFKKCLQFSYNMHGTDVFLLKVFLKTALGWGEAIWIQHSNRGPNWHKGTVPITSFQPFQIVFQAHLGVPPYCDIGIDDVKIVDCPDAELGNTSSREPWTRWKKCDQSCGANYRSRVRFLFSRETKQAYDFNYQIRYETLDKLCPEEHRWYFDDLKDGTFTDEYGNSSATVISGRISDEVLDITTGQESVMITFPEDSCIFGVKDCEDGFTMSFWIHLQLSPGGSSILFPESKKGLKVTLVDHTTAGIIMDIKGKQWNINASITTLVWSHVTITWSACHGLTFYENGQVKEHLGVFKTVLGDSTSELGVKKLFVGKSGSIVGAIFSMVELVLWNGILSPPDVKALYTEVDQSERFMFLKTSDNSFAQWKRNYLGTPSNDTGPSFTYTRSDFDVDGEDEKPTSCKDIKLARRGEVDGYYVIFPRGGCGDSLEVWCSDMNTTASPKEYIDVDPALNYAIYAGLDQPCQQSFPGQPGKTSFNKIRIFPGSMTVGTKDFSYATITGNSVAYGVGAACFRSSSTACQNAGHFNVNLKKTSVRVKPSVEWKGSGYWWYSLYPNFQHMINFRRSSDNREISANCGGYCGKCYPTGSLDLELASCIRRKPRSCADVKYYRDVNLDGNHTIYPYATGLIPIRVFCAGMSTSEPKEYINLLQDSDKNFALRNLDHARPQTCDIDPGTIVYESWRGTDGHSRFSKIRLNINNMEVLRDDHSFASNVFGVDISYAYAYDCFSHALCLPRGMFNIDLTGTGLQIKPDVTWKVKSWPTYHKTISTVREDFYRQIVDAKCGGWCGSCSPNGPLYLQVVVPYDSTSIRYFGKTNLSLVDTSDKGHNIRDLMLSEACSEAAGMKDGRIPDRSFSTSSLYGNHVVYYARLGHVTQGWRAKNGEVDPWLQVDLLFIRLVTGVATQAATSKYLKTYFLSYGFDADQMIEYLNDSKQRKIFDRSNSAGTEVVKEVLSNPFFARHVRFTMLTWEGHAKMAAEIYVCPRATLHHVIRTGDFHYLESSYPRIKGDRGELVTRMMPPMYTCAKFLYHMIGSDMGRLDVYVKEMDKERRFLWTIVGEQSSDGWKEATIPLKVDTAFKMIFVGIVGDGYKSDIAIGDVSLTNHINCTFKPSHAVPGPNCSTPCVGRSKCDNVTGKCVCFDDEFLNEKCQNDFVETVYKNAVHYWSFDDPDNVVDLKTGARAIAKKTTKLLSGPANFALLTTPEKNSGLQLGAIQHPCLKDPSSCPLGITISFWVKPCDIKNRGHYFITNQGNRLGISVLSSTNDPGLLSSVRGRKHKCNFMHNVYRLHWTWLFVAITWEVQIDGTGKFHSYLFDGTGMKRGERVCPEVVHSINEDRNMMETKMFEYKSGDTFAIDELAVWNETLTEERIMEIYNLVARNPSNYISWIFQLQSWSRPLLDLEDPEHETAIASVNSMIEKYIDNASVKKTWDDFTSDRCVYVGYVRNSVATWRDIVFYCNNSFAFQSKSEYFNLKLDVNTAVIGVNLNNINLGSYSADGSNTARGGFFETNQDDSNHVMVKEFRLDTNQKTSEFTFQDCDMSYSGATDRVGEYRLRGTQTYSPTGHCVAFHYKPVLSARYKIEAKFRHETAETNILGQDYSHMGFLLKYENNNNFLFFFVRTYHGNNCFELLHRQAGTDLYITGGACSGGDPQKGVWHTLTVHVDLTNIKAYLDSNLLLNEVSSYNPQPSKVGPMVWHDLGICASFKEFHVEEYFSPISIFPNIHVFQLPLYKDGVKSHKMKSVFGSQATRTPLNYTVSADFLQTTGGFGLCYNVKNDTNFDFVYYRRDSKMFAEVIQSVMNTSWVQNEISRDKIENSSLVLTSMSSRKVPTHVPFNLSSFAVNSTALNVSWHWSPDTNVTGVFVGFKILYRNEIDPPDSWTEKIIRGREFDNSSSVVLDRLRKSMEYSLKVVAFSFVGDGWPSQEIVNSTLDDFPDMADLNVSVKNVHLRSVFIEWNPLPKYNWNGLAQNYVITLLNIVDGVNHTFQTPLNTTNLTYTSLKHFTNYSVSLMALNNVGYSLPTQARVFQTLEHVPSRYPLNGSVTVLNTSALTMSWEAINEDLWHGMPLGYVIFCNRSNEGRNFTVTSSNLEFTVTNLTAFTFYDLTVAGYTRKGLGPRHPILTVRMSEEVPRIAPVNLRASTCRGSNITTPFPSFCLATLEWDPVPADKVRGIIRGYLATYEPSNIRYIKPDHRSLPDLMHLVTLNTSSTSFEVNLLFHTNYSMQVLAYTTGNGAPSSLFHFLTPERVPSRYPLNLSVIALNTSALTVSWGPIDDILWHGVPLGYVIFCNHSNEERNFTVTSSNLEFTVTNLTAFTFYDVTVAGYNREGLGPRHPTVTIPTREEVPRIAPVNLRILNQTLPQTRGISTNNSVTPSIPTSYSLSLEWSPVPADQVRGVIRGYTVTYEPVEVRFITRARRSLAGLMTAVTINTTSAKVELDNLLFYTNYSVQVQAYTTDNGVPSSVLHFMTPEGVPAEGPGNLHADNEGSKYRLSVKWDSIPVDRRNGILLGYHIYYHTSSSSSTTKNKTTTATNVMLTGLETFTSYDIRVCGYTVVGDGVCSQVSARTRSQNLAPYTPPWNATTVLTSPVSISLLWKPFPDSLWYDYPRGYRITFQRVALGGLRTSGDDVMIARVDYKTERYSWTNLDYYTKYKIEISTITYLGYGPKVLLYAETCDCPSLMTATFQILPPYVMRTADGKVSGIIPEFLKDMTSSCCVSCAGTVLNLNKDGLGKVSEKENYQELLESFDQATTFAFPIMGQVGRTSYASHFGFISTVESPGMVVMVKKKLPENLALGVLRSVFGIWPILLINVLLALVAGVIIWMLDSGSNEDIFPRSCIRGCLTGFWWAFVSMTTVGYGDTTAKCVPARIFAVIWILTGLCLYSILIGDLSSALSSTVSVSETKLYGAKVAALINSTEEMIAIRRNAKIVGGPYFSHVEIQKALIDGKVDAVIIDIYAAGLTKELWNHTELRISRILDYSSCYGIVIAGGTEGIQQCFRSYVHDNRIKTLDLILNYTTTLKGIKNEDMTEYVEDLIDGQSPTFRQALLALCIGFGVLFLLGIVWHYTCRRRQSTRMKKDNSVHPETIQDGDMFKDIKISYQNLCDRLQATKKRHRQQIRSLAKTLTHVS